VALEFVRDLTSGGADFAALLANGTCCVMEMSTTTIGGG
jgi:hypothetical protein